MNMSVQRADELAAVEASIETIQHSSHPRGHREFPPFPLLRLPTELILKIFEHAIESGGSPLGSERDPTLFVLTAICHELREIGITAPHLWSTVNLTNPPCAEIFLERCNHNPRILIIPQSTRERLYLHTPSDPREAIWLQLEGCAFNNLHSLTFEGTLFEFERRVVPILQRAANISSIDLQNTRTFGLRLPWHPSAPIPHLSALHLRGISTPWTSPLLRNLNSIFLIHLPNARRSTH